MTIVNSTPDDETVSGSSVVNTLPRSWEKFITKIAGIGILTILHPINDYDQFNDTDFFLEDEDEIVWDFETKTNFDFGWSCRC